MMTCDCEIDTYSVWVKKDLVKNGCSKCGAAFREP